MDKIGAYTGTADASNEFTEGNPSTGTLATEVDGGWLNGVQRELLEVMTQMGLTPTDADDTLVWQALQKVYGKTFAGDPNGNVAADVLFERCWDTSVSPPTLYIATAADGTAGGTTWTHARDILDVYSTAQTYTQAEVNALLQAAGSINGIVPSNNSTDPDHDLDFTSGVAFGGGLSVETPALTKQFDGVFAKGTDAGGLGGGVSLPADGTLHIFAIKEDATGDGDLYGDTDINASNVPLGWTVIRRAFSITTDAFNNLTQLDAVEAGGGALHVVLKASVQDVNTPSPGTAANTPVMSVPQDIKVDGIFQVSYRTTPADLPTPIQFFRVSSTDQSDEVADGTNYTISSVSASESGDVLTQIRTNTSGQIRSRSSAAFVTHHRIKTEGWIDWRAA